MKGDLRSAHPKGKALIWWSVSSCSTSISVLESPAFLGKSGERTMFSIETYLGRSIHKHSHYDTEDEILLPPGFFLRVVDVSNPATGLYIIHVRGERPPYKTLVEPFDIQQWKASGQAQQQQQQQQQLVNSHTKHHSLDNSGQCCRGGEELAGRTSLFRRITSELSEGLRWDRCVSLVAARDEVHCRSLSSLECNRRTAFLSGGFIRSRTRLSRISSEGLNGSESD